MRAVLCGAAVAMMVFGTASLAQSPLEGPLAAPGADPATKAVKAKPNRRKAIKSAHRAAPKPDDPGDVPGSPADDRPVASRATTNVPNDPMSFGMKWNGSNDTARETREQNYDGGAQGSGAEVGMKLHF